MDRLLNDHSADNENARIELEANLYTWADGELRKGKLQESDIVDIFPEDYSLRLGGENPNRNFRQMISDIAQSNAPPSWPGLLSILIGGAGVISCVVSSKKRKAEQANSGNLPSAGG